MRRFDLYTTIHKGIRRILFETTRTVGETDFEDAREAAHAAREIGRMLAFLDEHAAHEDEVILPELATLAPELHADLRADHARVDGLQREIAAIVQRLEGANASERASLGRRLENRMGKLVAAHMLHLASEETDANRVLWAHRDDAYLVGLQTRIVEDIGPTRLADWLALALPAMNVRERRELLAGMRADLPGDAFEAVTAAARVELGERRWSASLADAVR
ncbi:MAG: hemerythrin domain-containing protein [Planctomycetes bacterium]|nr:hemerythrin domain-containing protein [Planctomycetota bacterium]